MIFNKELDKALFLILKNDKKNRKDIVNLIKNMPEDLYLDILKTYEEFPNMRSEFANNKYACIIDKEKLSINLYDHKSDINMNLVLSTNEDIGYFSKTISSFNKNNEKIKKKEKKYNYSILNSLNEGIFIKTRESKIISGIPVIRDFNEEKIPELTLSYINKKFNK